jgi:hypothetical protein
MRPLPFAISAGIRSPPAFAVTIVDIDRVRPGTAVPFAYYTKLSAARQRVYRQSDAIETLDLPAGVAAGARVARIRADLGREDRPAVQKASQDLIDALVAAYRVPTIRTRVLAKRPADESGELHGLYEPDDADAPARITVWMRTAARRDVVAFKTFLRTLIHELCHHLDYELFELPETFHTAGFYKRESNLVNVLLLQESALAEPQGRLIW